MNFFKSIILDDPDSPKPDNFLEPDPNTPIKQPHEDRNPNDVSEDGSSADTWSYGGLIKTFATRSESLIETYRKDLEEFGSGLKKETEIIREAASRAVKDLPASLEAGTSAAHGVLDGVLKSTAEIISKETQAFASDGESEAPETNGSSKSGRYSWFAAQLSLIQSDLNTFCEEPEDVEEYKKWKLGFQLEDKRDENEIEGLIGENGKLEGGYEKVVPSVVDHETFFCRYFYRVDKLKQQDRVRVNLVKRAISVEDDDDELSWDVDDEGLNNGLTDVKERGDLVELNKKSSKDASVDEKSKKSEESVERKNNENARVEKIKSGEKKGDVFVMSDNQVKMEEEDLGWKDTGSGDGEKISTTTQGGRPPIKANPREKLNVEEDDEDLSWDIEDDDDEPVKS